MRAVRIVEAKGPQGLELQEVPAPSCGPEQLVVGVKAAGINRADLLQTLGLYPAPAGAPADIPGLEYAGVVSRVGEKVTRFKAGDRVMGIVGGGAWAEEVLVHEQEAMMIPPGLELTAAGGVPEVFATAFDALVTQGGVGEKTNVLITAASSGVGLAAVQLCAALGATAIGVGRSRERLARCTALGLSHALWVTEPAQFAQRARDLTGGRGAEVALDLVGGSWFPETVEALAKGGTLMLVGLLGGAAAELKLGRVLMNRLKIQGTTLRSRSLEEKIRLARDFTVQVLPHFATGQLKPVIDSTLPMAEAAVGLARVANNEPFGKVVLTW
jgi:NADPH2:quinone reductase